MGSIVREPDDESIRLLKRGHVFEKISDRTGSRNSRFVQLSQSGLQINWSDPKRHDDVHGHIDVADISDVVGEPINVKKSVFRRGSVVLSFRLFRASFPEVL